jgi:hypothetical protein
VKWPDGEPEVPEGLYKRFSDMTVCGSPAGMKWVGVLEADSGIATRFPQPFQGCSGCLVRSLG